MSDPSQLEKLVKLLAKKVEDFQNYVGIDAPYDAGIDTLKSEIESLKNPKITQFWKNLSSKQQGELHSMVTTYLYNKAIKADPDSFDGETPQKIVYKLSQKTKAPAGGATGGMDKLVKYLAKESENYMNNLGLDSPEYIEFYQIEDVIDNIKNPKIKNIWNSMKSPQQEDLYDKVVAVLKKKYGSEDEYDDMLENTMNEESNTVDKVQTTLTAKGFQGDQYKINLQAWLCFTADGNKYLTDMIARQLGVDKLVNEKIEKYKNALKDAVKSGAIPSPKAFTREFGIRDGVIDSGIISNVSGTNKIDETATTATYDNMLENKLNEIQTRITEGSFRPGGLVTPETEADWAALRRYEKGDDDGPMPSPGGGYRRKPIKGITFFNVPAGKESEATKAGLTQFKSGKWGFKHNFDPQVVSVASDREKSAVSDAEKIFGKGRYWEPKS